MSENVESVRRVYEALNRGDWDAAYREMSPDFELTTQRGPSAGTHRRREQVQAFTEDYIAAFDDYDMVPEELLESGDQVLAMVTRRARPKGVDAEIVVHNGHLWTIRDGAIVSMQSYPDPKEALEALGLPPA